MRSNGVANQISRSHGYMWALTLHRTNDAYYIEDVQRSTKVMQTIHSN